MGTWLMIAVAWLILIGSVLYLISYRKRLRPEDWWITVAIISLCLCFGPGLTLVFLYHIPTPVQP